MARYIEDRRSTLFVNGSLESLLPPDSVARVLWAALDELDFSAFESAYCNEEQGRRAIEPRRLAGVWIMGLLRGVTSSVALARACAVDIELRWLLGDAPVKKSTLCAFRKRHVEALRDLSTQVLAALARGGLLPAEELVVDGTVIRAAASCRANVKRKTLVKRVRRLSEAIEEKLEAGDEQSDEVEALGRRKARLEAALAEMAQLTKKSERITITEPEATLKKLKQGGFGPSHNIQSVSDAQSGAVISVAVVDQGNDQGLLEPDVAAAREELEGVAERLTEDSAEPGPIRHVCADGAYHDTLDLKALEEQGIAAVVPAGNGERKAPGVSAEFEAGAFCYDEDSDTMRCPHGHTLERAGYNDRKTAARYRAKAGVCAVCPSKGQCCPKAKSSGRSVNRPLYPEVAQAVENRVASPLGERLLRARSVTAEGVFARLIERFHWRRCRTWGRRGAQAEGLWRQIAHNLFLLSGYWSPLVFQSA